MKIGDPPYWDDEFALFLHQVWAAVESLDGEGIADTIYGQLTALPRKPQFAEIMIALGVLYGEKRIAISDPSAPWTGQWADVKWRSIGQEEEFRRFYGVEGPAVLGVKGVRRLKDEDPQA